MSAAARTFPDEPDPTLPPTWLNATQRRDPWVTAVALGMALLVHVAVLLFVAFPERGIPVSPQEPGHTPPEVTIYIPPPPPLEPPPRPLAAPDRRIPLPESDPPQMEPLREEPIVNLTSDLDLDELTDLPWDFGDPPPVPVERGVPGVNGISHPVLIEKIEPIYPELARQARLGGEVVLQAVVGRDGAVAELRVLRADPEGVGFEHAAIAAVSRWRYEPALQRGRAVEVYLTVHVRFTIH